ncbi:MAG TPA: fumarate reductase subunit C [Blastocatellia bacterium]|nr:fumarate reductase subunit C [Blastocatellia bacterium]
MGVYTEYHPKWYRRHVSTWWWMGKWNYLKFIVRELTSLAVAWTVLLMLMLLNSLREGEGSYRDFLEVMRSPGLIALNLLALLLTLFHSITWFNLAPKALAVRVGGRRVPALMIALPHFLAWIVVSAVMAWLILRR